MRLENDVIWWHVSSFSTPCDFAGSEESAQFTYPAEESADPGDHTKNCWSGPSTPPQPLPFSGVHKGTQTEGPLVTLAPSSDSVRPEVSFLSLGNPALTPCPSPVPVRKRAYAKWENRASTVQKSQEPEEQGKQTQEQLEKARRPSLTPVLVASASVPGSAYLCSV